MGGMEATLTAIDILLRALDGVAPRDAAEAARRVKALDLGYLCYLPYGTEMDVTPLGAELLGWDEQMEEGPTCNLCDGLGHGYPGAGPCPLEERGADEGPGHAWER